MKVVAEDRFTNLQPLAEICLIIGSSGDKRGESVIFVLVDVEWRLELGGDVEEGVLSWPIQFDRMF